MRELVANCVRCSKQVYCSDGFLNGIVLETNRVLCFECSENDELVQLLNRLLEAEKAGVETLDTLIKSYPAAELDCQLTQIKKDAAWSCTGLIAAIRREGGTPSKDTGDFTEKVQALPALEEKLSLLCKGQAWVARKINNALAFGMHEDTRTFLSEMKHKHEIWTA